MPAAVAIRSSAGIALAIVSRIGVTENQQKEHACPEDNAERDLPPDSLRQNDRKGEEGIDAHSRGHRERQLRIESHKESHDEAKQHRRCQHTAERHACSFG